MPINDQRLLMAYEMPSQILADFQAISDLMEATTASRSKGALCAVRLNLCQGETTPSYRPAYPKPDAPPTRSSESAIAPSV